VTHSARLTAVVALVALAACKSSTPAESTVFGEPSSVAVFRGVTLKSGLNLDPNAVYPYRPYIAVANAASNSISVIDGIDDSFVQSPSASRGLVYSAPGRPVLLASADLGDRRPDLLVVVTAGDLPWLGGSHLSVVRTWRADGSIVDRTDGAPAVDFGADIVALLPLPPDPAALGTVTIVAALADERIATVKFSRKAGDPEGAIDVDAAQATVLETPATGIGALGFQPLTLAAIPGERNRIFAATTDPIGGVQGVAQIDVTGTPVLAAALNAHAPTRLVAAGHLVEGAFGVPALDGTPFTGQPAVDRVWAVLDESGCGLRAPIACGVVAIDPATRDLVPEDPIFGGSTFRAPIPIGYPLAIGASPPPAVAPGDNGPAPDLAVTLMRIEQPPIARVTTGVAGVVSSDGAMTYVDLGRWDIPTSQFVLANVKGTVSSTRPSGATGSQSLTLVDPASGTTISQTDAARLSAAVAVTGGYTPTDRWTVTAQGALPGLVLRRAQAFDDGGSTSLALQTTSQAGVQEVVRLWDPTLGVTPGDIVVIEPTGLGTCSTFEATVGALAAPTIPRPGGFVTLGHRTPTNPGWDRCVDDMRSAAATGATYLVTFRAGGFVLVRGAGEAAVHVGRPVAGERFEVRGSDETALASACLLPPAAPWQASWSTSHPACDPGSACRDACEQLQRVRLARRVGYVWEAPAGLTGPALGFTLGLTAPTSKTSVQPRDVVLTISTVDGRAPYRVAPTVGFSVDGREVVTFDRSPWVSSAGPRFLVPYKSGVVMDSTPTLGTNQTTTMR
jgi:hypothetical protein